MGNPRFRDVHGDVWEEGPDGHPWRIPVSGPAFDTAFHTMQAVRHAVGPLTPISAEADDMTPGAPAYRDKDGDVWHRTAIGRYTMYPPTPVGAPLVEIRIAYGPLEPVHEDDTEPAPAYRDCDGDIWYRGADGRYVLSLDSGGSSALSEVRDLYGPLEAADSVDSTEHQDASTTSTRAEVLTVAVQLARQVHGERGHPANIAGMADEFARFILGER